MQRIGHGAKRLLAQARLPWAALGGLAALVPALWMWGFTVDDALISVRYARHVAYGLGWRFNAHGPTSDGVTPLLWPIILAPFARADALGVLGRAKVCGLVAWVGAATALGVAVGGVGRAPWWGRAAALVVMGLSVPIAAYAVSGMETALVTALATVAAIAVRRPIAAAALAGLAASFRPEMAPWACVLGIGASLAARESFGRVAAATALSIGPFVCCATLREVVWGRPAPLAVLAKPGELEQGLAYAGAACVVTLTPILALAPLALRRVPAAIVIAIAAVLHCVCVASVGGDWMPYARLMVPVAPSVAYASVLASARASPWAVAARSLSAIALGLALVGRGGTRGRTVGSDRAALVARARGPLLGAGKVAALDVGWVSAATEGDIVDLAGLTDVEIATLPGGHTSKRVDAMFLLARAPDALVLYAPGGLPHGSLAAWTLATYPRIVEARLARDPVIERHFDAAAWLPLGPSGGGYVLLLGARGAGNDPR
jgi:hypothetical protein